MVEEKPDFSERLNEPGSGLGALCHLLGFCTFIFPFGNIVGPLVLWIWKKGESPWVDYHGREALNFQISFFIYFIVLGIFGVSLLGLGLALSSPFVFSAILPLVLLVALFLFWVILIILAALKASNGEKYRYPFTIRFLK
ncbi:MAG: DUF4870 domain-containing protein [bacterium]|nr:DUF4870 domain-containing protein [bacterium]